MIKLRIGTSLQFNTAGFERNYYLLTSMTFIRCFGHLFTSSSFLCHFYQAAVSVKINNLLVCFCCFELFCPILEKDVFGRKFVYCFIK